MAEAPKKDIWTSVIAVAGFVIVIAIALWGAANAARLAPSFFGTLASPQSATTTIEITAPQAARSGETLIISWKDSKRTDLSGEDGTYHFAYECEAGFTFQLVNTDGTMGQTTCGSAFAVPNNATMIRLMPLSPINRAVDVPLTISFIKTNGERIGEGRATITIVNEPGTATSTPTNPKPATTTPSYPAPTPVPMPNGQPDLSVHITSATPFMPGTVAEVHFEVRNVGTGSSGSWYFTAQLPTAAAYTYTSPSQKNLNPGDWIALTLRFDNVQSGAIFSVTVDPNNQLHESSRANNTASQQY